MHTVPERKGTPLFGATLPEEKVVSLLEHIDEGCGVRKTSRLVGVHRDTVTRYSRLGPVTLRSWGQSAASR